MNIKVILDALYQGGPAIDRAIQDLDRFGARFQRTAADVQRAEANLLRLQNTAGSSAASIQRAADQLDRLKVRAGETAQAIDRTSESLERMRAKLVFTSIGGFFREFGSAFDDLSNTAERVLKGIFGILEDLGQMIGKVAQTILGALVSAFEEAAGAAGKLAIAAGGLEVAFAGIGIHANKFKEESLASLYALTKNKEVAEDLFNFSEKMADRSRFGREQTLQATQSLVAFGISAKQNLELVLETAAAMRRMGRPIPPEVPARLLAAAQAGVFRSREALTSGITLSDLREQGIRMSTSGRINPEDRPQLFGAVQGALEKKFGGTFDIYTNQLETRLTTFWNNIQRIAGMATQGMFKPLEDALGVINDQFQRMLQAGQLDNIIQALAVPFDMLGKALTELAPHLPEFVKWLESIITRENVVHVISDVVGFIRKLWDEITKFVMAATSGKGLVGIWDAFKNAAHTAIDWVYRAWNMFTAAVGWLADHGPMIWKAIQDAWNKIGDAIQTVVGIVTVLMLIIAADKIGGIVTQFFQMALAVGMVAMAFARLSGAGKIITLITTLLAAIGGGIALKKGWDWLTGGDKPTSGASHAESRLQWEGVGGGGEAGTVAGDVMGQGKGDGGMSVTDWGILAGLGYQFRKAPKWLLDKFRGGGAAGAGEVASTEGAVTIDAAEAAAGTVATAGSGGLIAQLKMALGSKLPAKPFGSQINLLKAEEEGAAALKALQSSPVRFGEVFERPGLGSATGVGGATVTGAAELTIEAFKGAASVTDAMNKMRQAHDRDVRLGFTPAEQRASARLEQERQERLHRNDIGSMLARLFTGTPATHATGTDERLVHDAIQRTTRQMDRQIIQRYEQQGQYQQAFLHAQTFGTQQQQDAVARAAGMAAAPSRGYSSVSWTDSKGKVHHSGGWGGYQFGPERDQQTRGVGEQVRRALGLPASQAGAGGSAAAGMVTEGGMELGGLGMEGSAGGGVNVNIGGIDVGQVLQGAHEKFRAIGRRALGVTDQAAKAMEQLFPPEWGDAFKNLQERVGKAAKTSIDQAMADAGAYSKDTEKAINKYLGVGGGDVPPPHDIFGAYHGGGGAPEQAVHENVITQEEIEEEYKKNEEMVDAYYRAQEEWGKAVAENSPKEIRAARMAGELIPLLQAEIDEVLVPAMNRYDDMDKRKWDYARKIGQQWDRINKLNEAELEETDRNSERQAKDADRISRDQVKLAEARLENNPLLKMIVGEKALMPALMNRLQVLAHGFEGETEMDKIARLMEKEETKTSILRAMGLLPKKGKEFGLSVEGGLLPLFNPRRVQGALAELDRMSAEEEPITPHFSNAQIHRRNELMSAMRSAQQYGSPEEVAQIQQMLGTENVAPAGVGFGTPNYRVQPGAGGMKVFQLNWNFQVPPNLGPAEMADFMRQKLLEFFRDAYGPVPLTP